MINHLANELILSANLFIAAGRQWLSDSANEHHKGLRKILLGALGGVWSDKPVRVAMAGLLERARKGGGHHGISVVIDERMCILVPDDVSQRAVAGGEHPPRDINVALTVSDHLSNSEVSMDEKPKSQRHCELRPVAVKDFHGIQFGAGQTNFTQLSLNIGMGRHQLFE